MTTANELFALSQIALALFDLIFSGNVIVSPPLIDYASREGGRPPSLIGDMSPKKSIFYAFPKPLIFSGNGTISNPPLLYLVAI